MWEAGGNILRICEAIEEIATFGSLRPARGRVAGALFSAMAGAALVGGVVVLGNYADRSANAHSGPGTGWEGVVQPSMTGVTPASSTRMQQDLDGGYFFETIGQQVAVSRKNARLKGFVAEPVKAVLLRPTIRPMNKPKLLLPQRPQHEVMSPPANKLRSLFRRGETVREQIRSQREAKIAEHRCLAKAIYFEARSEPKSGQLAVANVVMNRVKSEGYPNTICGVVYENRTKKKKIGGCQFSFTCDGLHDRPKSSSQWDMARKLARQAMADKATARVVNTSVMHYHADYVRPKWSKSMRRMTKIGRHIFYVGT